MWSHAHLHLTFVWEEVDYHATLVWVDEADQERATLEKSGRVPLPSDGSPETAFLVVAAALRGTVAAHVQETPPA